MGKRLKEEIGITLIALIITIIILLILAGIVINLSVGDNGIIKKTQDAARNYTKASNEESEWLDQLANFDVNNSDLEEIYGIWRVSKNTKNYAPNALTLQINSIYHDDNIMSLNQYKEKIISDGLLGNLGYNVSVIDMLIMMSYMFDTNQNSIKLLKVMGTLNSEGGIEDSFALMENLANRWIQYNNLPINQYELLYERVMVEQRGVVDQSVKLNDICDKLLEGAGISKEQIEEEYKQYVQNFETNKNIPNEIKAKTYIITYPDGTKEEVLGSNLSKFEMYYDVTENGIQNITIEEANQKQEIEINVDKIIKTVKDGEYIYIPYSTGYAVKAIDKTLTSYTMPKTVINGIPVTSTVYMFADCEALTSLDLREFDTSKVTNMLGMFSGCKVLTNLNLSGLNTNKVTDVGGMFDGCKELRNLNLNGFNTSKIDNMTSMFSDCNALTNLDVSGFDTSSVMDMRRMFNNCNALTSLDVSGFNTSKVIDMNGMFKYCNALTNIDVSKFNTSKVTNMGNMFAKCTVLKKIDVSNFDTSNVTNMGGMFWDCFAVEELDVSNFKTSKVTDMSYMFTTCQFVKDLEVSRFDTSNVTKMNSMFCNCHSITNLNLNNFDTSKVTDMKWMFWQCRNMTQLDLRSFDTSKVTDMSKMFQHCSKLTNILVSSDKWIVKEETDITDMFTNCGVSEVTKNKKTLKNP